MQAFAQLLIDRPNTVVVLVDGADPAHARRRHDQGADERRPGARTARPAEPRPGADSRPFRCAGRRGSGLRADDRRGRHPQVCRGVGLPVSVPSRMDDLGDDRSRGGRRRRSVLDRRRQFSRDLPDADRSRRALQRPGLRVHQDIVLSSSMLAAATATSSSSRPRRGGVRRRRHGDSTERRIIFSPEIPGRRI
jgi:hypothetical protein